MLTMCVLYIRFGSSVTPSIGGGGCSWVVLCCLFVDEVWCYYSARSGMNSVPVILSALSMSLLSFVHVL